AQSRPRSLPRRHPGERRRLVPPASPFLGRPVPRLLTEGLPHWSLQPPAPHIAHSLAFLTPIADSLNAFLKMWDRKGPYRGPKYPASFWAEVREAGVARGEVPPRGDGLRAGVDALGEGSARDG